MTDGVGTYTHSLDGTDYAFTSYQITESSVVTVTYFDSAFNTVGTKVTNADGDITFNIKIALSSGAYVEEGSYQESGDSAATYRYNYSSSSAFTGGSETKDNVTTTFDANWDVTSEVFSGSLGDALSASAKADLAPGVLASSGDTYATTGSDGETVYRDANSAVTGYKYTWSDGGSQSGAVYYDANENWVGDTFTDGLLETSNFVTTSASGRTETGSYVEKDSGGSTLFSRTFTYNFDSAGNFTGGTEEVDGETTTYGANWVVEGKSVSASALTTATAASGIPETFIVSGETHTITETFGDDTEITYYSADGSSVLGRQLAFSFDSGGTTTSGATFVDADYNWIGDTFSDGTWTARRFETDNGNGTKTETGFESDGTGWSREWVFVFDSSNGNFLSGTETQNGITTTFGANWQIEGRSADTSSLGTVDDATVLSELPTSFVLTNANSENYALYKLFENDWGDETTYFNADGDIIGYAFEWSDGAGSSGISYNDADWNFLGDVYISGGFKNVRFETDNGDGTRTETGAEYVKNTSTNQWDLERSWTFKFDSSYNLIEGTETRSGVTTEFGAGWSIVGESVDVTAASLTAITDLDAVVAGDIKLSDLYNFTANVNDVATTAGYYASEASSWGGGTETTYFNAAGGIVGRKSEYSFSVDYGDGAVTQTGASFFDGNDNWIGDIFDDTNWSGSRFELKTADGGRREIGSESDATFNWSRSYEYTFGADGNLISGTETENGTITTYGANWSVTGRTADTSGATEVTDAAALAEIPSTFLINANLAKYTETSGEWGSERTYFSDDGTILGYAYSWNDGWATGTSFNDANWNFLGDIFISGDGYKNVRFETDNGDGTRTETGAEYQSDGSGGWTLLRSWEFNFNGYDMIGGTETRADGVEVEFDAGWIVKAEKVATSSLDPISDLTAEVSATTSVSYAELFDFTITGVANTVGFSKTTPFDHGGGMTGSETVFYNGNGEVVGRAETFSQGGGESGTQYFDANYMWIGEVFTSGSDSRTIFTLENADGSYTEFGSETFAGTSRSWEFNFSSNWDFLGGTEVENGISRDVNAQGQVTNETLDLTAVTLLTSTDEATLAELPDIFKFGDPEQVSYIEETYPGGTETIYFGAANEILGRATSWTDPMFGGSGTDFFDENYDFIGNIFEDSHFKQVRFETKTKDVDGNVVSITEKGTEYEPDGSGGWTEVRSFTFNFDGNYNLVDGTEKFGGETINFGAGWQVASTAKDLTALSASATAITAAGADADVLLDLGLTGGANNLENGKVTLGDLFDFSGGGFAAEESLTWGSGTETTYYDSNGAELGRKVVDGSFTQYFDKDWMFIGESVSDTFTGGNFERSFFNVKEADGGRIEINSEVELDTSGSTDVELFSRESVFKYAANGAFEGGREIENGISYEIGSDWSRDQQARDVTSLKLLATDASYDIPVDFEDLPDTFKFDTDSDTNLDGVYREVAYSSGTDTQVDFYDPSTGKKIGESYSYLDFSGETVTSYMDANYNWIGDVREEAGVRKEVYTRTESQVTVGENVETHTNEIRKIYTWDTAPTPADWKLEAEENFTFGPSGMLGGSETRDGITTVYDAGWTVQSETANTSSLSDVPADSYLLGSTTLKLNDIFDFTGADATKAYYKEDSYPDPYRAGATNENITYYKATAAGAEIVGYAYGGAFTEGNNVTEFINYEGVTPGELYRADRTVDTKGTSDTADDVMVRAYQRYTQDNRDGTYSEVEVEFSTIPAMDRTSTFTYRSSDDYPLSGVEVENGITTQLQVVNGEFIRQAPTVDLSGGLPAGMTALTGTDLDELPSEFQFGASGSETAYRKTVEDTASFKEYHFFDAGGAQLGKAFVNISGSMTITNFQDSSMPYGQYLGRIEENAGSSKFVDFETRSLEDIGGVSTKIVEQTGTAYSWIGGDWQEDNSYYYKFKVLNEAMMEMELLSGYQIYGTQKTNYGPNWSITGTEYYADGAAAGGPAIGDITIPFLIEAAPRDWNMAGLQVVMTPDANAPANLDFAGQVSYFLSGNFLGDADAQFEYFVSGDPLSGVKNGSISIYNPDGDKVGDTTITFNNDGSSYITGFTESGTPSGGSEVGYFDINIDPEGRRDETIDGYAYDANGDLLGTMEMAYDGTYGRTVTRVYDANGDEILADFNSAPTTTALAASNAPGGVVATLTEDAATTSATGSLSGYFTDLEEDDATLDLLLVRADNGQDASVQSKVGKYGSLSFDTTTNTWTYTIDNTKTQILVDGQTDVDTFVIEIRDPDGLGDFNHSAYYDLNVEINGADDGFVTSYNPGVHGGLTLKEYVIDGFSIVIDEANQGAPVAGTAGAAASLKIIGSDDLEIASSVVGTGANAQSVLVVTAGKVFDVLVNDDPLGTGSYVSIADSFDSLNTAIIDTGSSTFLNFALPPATGTLADLYLFNIDGAAQAVPDAAGVASLFASVADVSQTFDLSANAFVDEFAFTDVNNLPVTIARKFSLDLADPTPVGLTSGALNQAIAAASITPVLEENRLEVSQLDVKTTEVTSALDSGTLGVSLALDDFAQFSRPYTQTITVTIRDAGGTTGQWDAGEREITALADVTIEADGTAASVGFYPGNMLSVNYTLSDGTTNGANPITFVNSSGRMLTFDDTTSSLNINFGQFLDDLGSVVDINLLGDVGTYEYEISGLGNFLEEMPGTQPMPGAFYQATNPGPTAIDLITGTIGVYQPAADVKFDVDFTNPPSVTMGGETVAANKQGGILGGVLNLASVDLPSNKIQAALDGDQFGIAFNLETIGSFDTDLVDQVITVKVRDLNEGAGNQPDRRDDGEREISASFKVNVSGNGATASIENVAGGKLTGLYTLGDGSEGGVINETNTGGNFITVNAGAKTVSMNLASLLDQVEGVISTNLLTQQGTYEYEISGLGNFFADSANTINEVKGVFNVTAPVASTDQPFDLDITAENQPVIYFAGEQEGLESSYDDTHKKLTLNDVVLEPDEIETVIDTGNLRVEFELDQIAKYTNQTQTVTIKIKDVIEGHGNSPESRDGGERELTAEFDLTFSGDGSSATIKSTPGSQLKFSADGGSGPFVYYTNAIEDVISIGGANSNLQFNIGSILQKMASTVGNEITESMLTSVGKYYYEVTGLGTVLHEGSNPVDKIEGLIRVEEGSGVQKFDLDITNTGSTTPKIYYDGKSDPVGVTRDADTLKVANIMLDGGGIGSVLETGQLGVSFKLDEIANFDAPVNVPITIKLRDVVGTADNTKQSQESEITATFSLTVDGNGSLATISSAAGSQMIVSVTGSGVPAVMIDNVGADVINIDNVNTTLNVNIGSIIEKALQKTSNFGISEDTFLKPGQYEYEVSGLGPVVAEGANAINKVIGTFDVKPGLDIQGGTITFDQDPTAGVSMVTRDLVKNLEADTVKIPDDVLNGFGDPGFSAGVSMSLQVGTDFIKLPDGHTSMTQAIKIELIDNNDLDYTYQKGTSLTPGDRYISAEFDINITKVGSNYEIVLPAQNIDVDVWDSLGNGTGSGVVENGDNDTVTLTTGVTSGVGDLNIKLDSLLEKASAVLEPLGMLPPDVSPGEEFMFIVSTEDPETSEWVAMAEFDLEIVDFLVSDVS